MSGSYGSDTYQFTASATTNVTIQEDGFSSDVDRVIIDSSITPSMLTLSRGNIANGEMILNFGSTKGILNIENIDKGAAKTIEEIRFADNSSLTPIDLMNKYFASVSTSGNDTIVGFATDDIIKGLNGDDTITGGAGDDILSGGDGNDTYIYNVGDGNDLIKENHGNDTLVFGAGITASEIRVSRDNSNIWDGLITFANHTGSIRVTDLFYDLSGIENFQFADGTVLTKAQLEQDYLAKHSTSGNDFLMGGIGADVINGGAGDDIIKGLDGDDTITGGAGDDILSGGDGNDTYIYNVGDGNDLIKENHGNDTLVFGAGITASEIRVSRDNSNIWDGLITFANHTGSIRVTDLGAVPDN